MKSVLVLSLPLAILASCAAAGDSNEASGGGGPGSSTSSGLWTPDDCPAGAVVCSGSTAKTCDGHGGFTDETDCSANGQQCAESYGCVACVPFQDMGCDSGVGTMCDASGSGPVQFACDADEGMVCAPDGCHGACSPSQIGPSYIGCDYWPTVTWNGVLRTWFHFAAVVANASQNEAHVKVLRGTKTVATVAIAPGSLASIDLPWVPELKGEDSGSGILISMPKESVRANGGAYHLKSDEPVTVHQFNALEYQDKTAPTMPYCEDQTKCCPDPNKTGGCYSYSNDASLLLPSTSLRSDYAVLSYRTAVSGLAGMYDFFAITATRDGTAVEIRATTTTDPGGGMKAMSPGGTQSLMMNAGDVVEVLSSGVSLSGTRIWSPNGMPFQVISGMPAAEIPDGVHAADHIEEVVPPIDALGKDYVVTAPTTPLGKRIHTVRIQPIEDATSLTFDPPSVHAPVKLDAWEALEIQSLEDAVRVIGDKTFGVTQYMHGQGVGPQQDGAAGAGDPSQGLAIPTAQYRTSYVFLAPADYDASYVNITAPEGTNVVLDGAPIDASEINGIGQSHMTVARHLLAPAGAHEIHADQPFGITVYGYGLYTSYMVPGGLDVKRVATPPPPK